MSRIKLKGFDKLKKELKKMKKAAEDLSNTKQISFDDLFNSNFISAHTNFTSFNELLAAGGFTVNSQEDFEAIPEDEFDKHIRATTKFKSWQQMLDTATEKYVTKKLGS